MSTFSVINSNGSMNNNINAENRTSTNILLTSAEAKILITISTLKLIQNIHMNISANANIKFHVRTSTETNANVNANANTTADVHATVDSTTNHHIIFSINVNNVNMKKILILV